MTEFNKDGLVPGASVSYEELIEVEQKRKKQKNQPEVKRRGRPKASKAN